MTSKSDKTNHPDDLAVTAGHHHRIQADRWRTDLWLLCGIVERHEAHIVRLRLAIDREGTLGIHISAAQPNCNRMGRE